MKIKKSFIGIFLVTFFIGCAVVFFLIKDKTSLKPEKQNPVSPVTETVEIIETQPKRVEKPFVPEIFGLKDFPDYSPKYRIKLVDVAKHGNSYRAEEVIAKNGEIWLGVFADGNDSYLKNTKIKIDLEIDPDYTGATINFKEANKPLFLLRNAKNLKEGNIVTLYREPETVEDSYNDSNTMYNGFAQDFQLGERKYSLRVKAGLTKSSDKVLALVLETESKSQVVTYGAYFDGDFLGDLLWVGDLDGDGKLDLYMNYNSFEKGSFSSSLFLSSEAENGKLVKEIAGFGTAGC